MTKTVTVRTTDTDGTVTEVEQTTNYDAGSGTGTVIAVDNPYATQSIVRAVWAKIGGLGTYRTGRCAMFGGILTEPSGDGNRRRDVHCSGDDGAAGAGRRV